VKPRGLVLDFEGRSDVDLNKCGTGPYFESPNTRITMLAWNWTDQPADFVRGLILDDKGAPDPSFSPAAEDVLDFSRALAHIAAGGLVIAHNAQFEISASNMLFVRGHWYTCIRPEQAVCTMALGRALSFPAKLEKLAPALRLPFVKDDVGHRIMLKLCKPRKPRKGERTDVILWNEDRGDVERELVYCKADVRAERAAYDVLPGLIPAERETWLLDREINERGIYVDLESVRAAEQAVAEEQARLESELYQLTGGAVPSIASPKLRGWIAAHGLQIPDMRKATVKEAIARPDLPPLVARALHIRQVGSKSSTAKLTAFRLRTSSDSRARNTLEYHGAGTGRWAGRGIQTQNMPRTPKGFGPAEGEDVLAWLRRPGGAHMVRLHHGDVCSAVSYSLRSLIMAAPGNDLIAGDFSNIEGRVLAWLAGEEWKLDAFRAYDTIIPGKFDAKGEPVRAGPDLYVLAVANTFGKPVEAVTGDERQNVGKVQELALGFQGAHGAYLSMFKTSGAPLSVVIDAVKKATDPHLWADVSAAYWNGATELVEEILEARRIEAKIDYEINGEDEPNEFEPDDHFDVMAEAAKKNRYGLLPDEWTAIRLVVDGWRAAHPRTCALWRSLETAACDAVQNPGRIYAAGKISYMVRDVNGRPVLLSALPSGRCLGYPFPKVIETKSNWTGKTQRKLEYLGVNSKTRKWGVQKAYGGLLAENVTQATARDALDGALKRLNSRGYPVVMHVHDEAVCEIRKGSGALDEFYSIMRELPPWAAGLPVAVSGWRGERYRK